MSRPGTQIGRVVSMVVGLVAAAVVGRSTPASPPRAIEPFPNVVIVFVDDLGYGDLGVQGESRWSTPRLDQMAREGTRFTDFYVSQPVCSASRASLLTGCYANRIGISGALGPNARHGLRDEDVTIAELCRERGYRTAIFGKWHLGHRPQFLPDRHGFDAFLGIPYSNDMWPLHPDYVRLPARTAERERGYPDLPLYRDGRIIDPQITPEDQSIFTKRFTEAAVEFIRESGDQPFFLYVPHPMVHVPLYVSPRFDGASRAGRYGDTVREVDWSVGRILDAIDDAGLAERTLVLFISDNGPWLSYGTHAGTTGVLREGKGTTFEGGVRVPCLARWPGTVPAGTVCTVPLMTIDLLPTIAGLIGAELPDRPIDGRDAGEVLLGRSDVPPQEAYFFYYRQDDLEAMRSGRWKMHFPHGYRSMEGRTPGRDGMPGPYDNDRRTGLELYDLRVDPGETRNVAEMHPDVVDRLQALAREGTKGLSD